MSLGQALGISATGINSQSAGIQIVGNDIANINTTAFKGRRPDFANIFYQTIQPGAPADATNPGRSPLQLGLGVELSGHTIDLSQGTVNPTGVQTDFFITGSGYFLLRRDGQQVFTRSGAFTLDSGSNLVTPQGLNVRGFGVDDDYVIQTDAIVDLNIPLGQRELGLPTSNVFWQGTLNPTGAVATQATIRSSLATTATSLADPLGGILIAGVPLINDGSGGFAEAVNVTYRPRKASGDLAPATITLAPTDSVGRFLDFLVGSLQISTTAPQPPGNEPGAVLGGGGEFVFTGNLGTVNDFTLSYGDFLVRRVSDGALGAVNLSLNSLIQSANGESAAASGTVFDSNGEPVRLDASLYLVATSSSGSQWRILYASPDQDGGSDFNRIVGDSLLTFDNFGRIASVGDPDASIQLDDRTAATPLVFENHFDAVFALAASSSNIGFGSQDGLRRGALVDFNLLSDGVIAGIFENGGTRPLGQVLLAQFANPSGLIAEAQGIYVAGAASGPPQIRTPGDGVGTTASGGLENSNVDFADSLVSLLNLSLAFAANSRAFATADELIANFTRLIQQQ
jgi:flagellar hook protein FlgE